MARTKIDFSGHKLEVIKSEGVLIHKFKRPDTTANSVVFINTCGVMTVTGDFGNWVFSREFHPSPSQEKISNSYWDEKLQNNSIQTASEFDGEATRRAIVEFKEDNICNYSELELEAIEDWIEKLEDSIEDEIEYTFIAYREKPNCIDYENIPFTNKRRFSLEAIYDSFEAICQRLWEEVR